MYDLIIVGGGPAGVAGGVYAARKKIKTLLIAESFGGQSIVSQDIQNWIGSKTISGLDLAKNLEEHLRAQDGTLEILEGERVKTVRKNNAFAVETESGKSFETKTVLVAAGSRRRKLGVPGESKLDGRGVIYCTTCDAPLFNGKTVAVIGGGNAGLEGARDFLSYCPKVYILQRGPELKGDPVTAEKLRNDPRVTILLNAETTEILGENFVTGLKYKDKISGEIKELHLEGIGVEIGSLPNSEMVKDCVKLNEIGEIIVDHKTQATSTPGIWAAGDVADVLYKQNNISAGDAVKAILNIDQYLHKNHS